MANAFIDRAPIDWAALLARARGRDRVFFENLRLLDRLRPPTSPVRPGLDARPWPILFARLVLALGGLQTICGLGAIGVAFLSGRTATYRPPQILLALAFASACLLLGAASRDRRILYLLAAFAATASAFTRAALGGLPEQTFATPGIFFHGLVTAAFAPASLWQFALAFPHVRRFTLFDVLARRAAGLAWLLGGLLFGINLAIAHHMIGTNPLLKLERSHPGHVFWHLFAIAALPALAAMLLRSRRAPPPERRKVARLALAIAAGLAPFLVCGLLRMALPQVDTWFLSARSPERRWADRLIIGSLAATPILSTVAMVAERPFGPQAIALGLMCDRLVRILVTAIVAVPFAALAGSLYRLRHVAIADIARVSSGWLLLAYAAVGCLLASRTRLLAAIARSGIRHVVGHQERLAAALEHLCVARGPREIGAVLSRELRDGVCAVSVRILAAPGADGGAVVDQDEGVRPMAPETVLLDLLSETTVALDLSPEGRLLDVVSQEDRDWLAANRVALGAPLKRRDGAVSAIVLLGPKRGGRTFDRRDRRFISTLIGAAAAAWDVDCLRKGHGAERLDCRVRSDDDAAFECARCGTVGDSRPLRCRCGGEAVPASLPHRLNGQFVVQRRVGTGGMGVAYVARDTRLDRDVALKTLPDLRRGMVTRLRDEARAMAALDHESLATIYGVELWRQTPVLVVEYFPRGTLAHRLERGPMSTAMALAIGVRLARALAYMHAKGVLHRDLKPSNIALTATGAPKLMDFGLATLIGPSSDADASPNRVVRRRKVAGTLAYLPPESYRGAPPDPAWDLWALSVVVFEAIAGCKPFAAGVRGRPIHGAVRVDVANACAAPPEAGVLLRAFFERALAREPGLRFQTSIELESALAALAGMFGKAALNRVPAG